jgi:2-keto-4-pentenoate hydratase/2-oxohepta-3-ene-1,7-dioic acid hydratase in catechol pathway
MRLCRFVGGYGIVEGDQVVDVSAYVGVDPSRGDPLILALPTVRALTTASFPRRPLAEVALLSPVRFPSKILAAPNNYRAHGAEMAAFSAGSGRGGTMAESGLFLKANSSLVGPSEGIAQRFLDQRTDHEVELVAVIGTPVTRPITKADALAHVAGYSLGLDITLRGIEDRSLRKSIDSYTVMGPWLVSADEMPDVGPLRMTLSLNGEPRQSTLLSDMVWDVADQIAYSSKFYALNPGDLIYTGTPAGVGPIRPGDVLHAACEIIGAMDVLVRDAEMPVPG